MSNFAKKSGSDAYDMLNALISPLSAIVDDDSEL